jgi:hypothetical protein
VEQLLSWESWRWNMKASRAGWRADIQAAINNPADAEAVRMLRFHEDEQGDRLHQGARPHFITRRSMRGWSKIRRWLLDNPKASRKDRQKLVRTRCRLYRSDSGSGELLEWLAAPEQDWIIKCPGPEPVKWTAELGSTVHRLAEAEAEPLPRFTLRADRGVELEYGAGKSAGNGPPYTLLQDDVGALYAAIPTPDGESIALPVSHSGQLTCPKLSDDKRTLRTVSQDRLDIITRDIGGARWRRSKDGKRHVVSFALTTPINEKEVGRRSAIHAFLKLNWKGRKTTITKHLDGSFPDQIVPGTSILAAHFGLRHAAACSIFRLVLPGDVRGRHVWGWVCGLAIVHERSFMLNLPGDVPDAGMLDRRREEEDKLWAVKRMTGAVGLARKLADATDADDREELRQALGSGTSGRHRRTR